MGRNDYVHDSNIFMFYALFQLITQLQGLAAAGFYKNLIGLLCIIFEH